MSETLRVVRAPGAGDRAEADGVRGETPRFSDGPIARCGECWAQTTNSASVSLIHTLVGRGCQRRFATFRDQQPAYESRWSRGRARPHDYRRAEGGDGGLKKNSGIENVNSALLTLSIVYNSWVTPWIA